MSKLHRSLFLKEIKTSFPELTPAINAEQGLLHFEMDVVRRFAQSLIDKGHKEALWECFFIINKYYLSGNKRIKDAIDVSFIEPLDFETTKKQNRKWAWELLPDALKELYTAFHVDTARFIKSE